VIHSLPIATLYYRFTGDAISLPVVLSSTFPNLKIDQKLHKYPQHSALYYAKEITKPNKGHFHNRIICLYFIECYTADLLETQDFKKLIFVKIIIINIAI
jgi:hypothetical protein